MISIVSFPFCITFPPSNWLKKSFHTYSFFFLLQRQRPWAQAIQRAISHPQTLQRPVTKTWTLPETTSQGASTLHCSVFQVQFGWVNIIFLWLNVYRLKMDRSSVMVQSLHCNAKHYAKNVFPALTVYIIYIFLALAVTWWSWEDAIRVSTFPVTFLMPFSPGWMPSRLLDRSSLVTPVTSISCTKKWIL